MLAKSNDRATSSEPLFAKCECAPLEMLNHCLLFVFHNFTFVFIFQFFLYTVRCVCVLFLFVLALDFLLSDGILWKKSDLFALKVLVKCFCFIVLIIIILNDWSFFSCDKQLFNSHQHFLCDSLFFPPEQSFGSLFVCCAWMLQIFAIEMRGIPLNWAILVWIFGEFACTFKIRIDMAYKEKKEQSQVNKHT